jgi:Flp pilus assembly protein TadG
MIRHLYRRFRRDTRATVAVITAIVIFPLLFLAIGVPIDLARAIQLRSALQNYDDAAALAGQLDIANGATANQACTLAFTMGAATISAPGGGLSNLGAGVTTAPGTSCDAAPQTSIASAPNSVTVTGGANLATTFTSFLRKTIPIATTATATGPQGFITICIVPTPSYSSDINQAYYYLRTPSGSFVNEDGTAINSADYPGLSTGPSSNISSGMGVELSAFLTDNAYPTAHGPNSPNTGANAYCDSAHTEVAVSIKNGLADRLGFEFVNITGGQFPCYYGAHTTGMTCLTLGTNYGYNPASMTAGLLSGNANGFQNFFLSYGTPLTFTTNAYGSFVGEQNLFFSTDYPSSYATNNQNTAILSPLQGAPLISSPVANNTCYEQKNALGITTTFNGYSTASQGCLLSQTPANPVAQSYGAAPDATITFGYTPVGQSKILVCLASDGSTRLNGTSYSPTTASGGSYLYVRGTTASSNVQQENMILANSSTGNGSLGAGVYQCPVNTVGNPYYPDPTCAELAGATLQVGWNDMGGFESDNGTSPADLSYSYSCEQPVAGQYTETALTQ